MKKRLILLSVLMLTIVFVACTGENSSTALPNNIKQTSPTTQSIIFPTETDEKTEFNRNVFDIAPFKLSVQLPRNWIIKERVQGTKAYPLIGTWCAMGIYNANDDMVGAVGYNIFEPCVEDEENPQAIYNQVALGNNYHFDAQLKEKGGAYTPVIEEENSVTAITQVYNDAHISKELGYGEQETINKGILSFNKELHVYISCEFGEKSLTEEELKAIAQSVKINPVT